MSEQQKAKNYKFINSFALKLFAIICMTIDHVGAVIGTEFVDGKLYLSGVFTTDFYWILRYIGRLAFPIFCYLIVEGFYHTKSVWKYLLRLFIFALISQIPFSLGINKTPFNFSELNVFFTLFMGLMCVYIFDSNIHLAKQKIEILANNELEAMYKEDALISLKNKSIIHGILSFISTLSLILLSEFLCTDYGSFGILIILIFYIFRGHQIKILIAMFLSILAFSNAVELYALIALVPIFLHNGKKGPSVKYAFYAYYPLHLTILYFVYVMCCK